MITSIHWSLFTLALLIFGGCGSVDPEVPEKEQYLNSILNGDIRQAEVTAAGLFPDNKISINSYRRVGSHYAWGDALSFLFVCETGRDSYPLSSGAGYAELSGPDAVIATYHAIDHEPHELRITHYDPASGLMEGEFQVTVVVDPDMVNNQMRQMPDTVRITDGRFRVVLWDVPE